MSGTRFETLRDVSETLVDLLKANLTDLTNRIALVSPRNVGQNRLTLFLYKVMENPELKNRDGTVVPEPGGTLRKDRAPLTLDAYYLLTSHAAGDPDLLAAHQALSR